MSKLFSLQEAHRGHPPLVQGCAMLCHVVVVVSFSSRLPTRAGLKCPKKRIAIGKGEGHGPWRAYRKVVSRGLRHVAYAHIMCEHVRVFCVCTKKAGILLQNNHSLHCFMMPVATVGKYAKIICDSNEKGFVLTFLPSLSLSLFLHARNH